MVGSRFSSPGTREYAPITATAHYGHGCRALGRPAIDIGDVHEVPSAAKRRAIRHTLRHRQHRTPLFLARSLSHLGNSLRR